MVLTIAITRESPKSHDMVVQIQLWANTFPAKCSLLNILQRWFNEQLYSLRRMRHRNGSNKNQRSSMREADYENRLIRSGLISCVCLEVALRSVEV